MGRLKQVFWSCYYNLVGILKGLVLDTCWQVHTFRDCYALQAPFRREMEKPWKDRLWECICICICVFVLVLFVSHLHGFQGDQETALSKSSYVRNKICFKPEIVSH